MLSLGVPRKPSNRLTAAHLSDPTSNPASRSEPAKSAGEQPRLQEATQALVARLARDYLRPQARRIVAALSCMVVVALSTAAFTQLIKPIIDDIFLNRREDMLVPIALSALAVFAAKGLATYGQ